MNSYKQNWNGFHCFFSMQRTGKQHPPALDVQGQRMFCAGRRERTVGAAKLPSKIAGTTWTVLTQLFSWHRQGNWRKFRFLGVCGDWLGGPAKQFPPSLAVLLRWAVFSLLLLNFCLFLLMSCGWDAALPTARLPSHFQCLRMPVLILLKAPKVIFFFAVPFP